MPSPIRTPWPDRVRVAAWAALAVAVAWPRLPGFTTDSDAMVDVAKTLLEGRGLAQSVVDFWRPAVPDPLGLWPPVYPLVVALLGALGVALPFAARLVSAGAFVLFALAFHSLARRAAGRPFAFVATLVVLLGPGLVQAGATAWSETLYLFLLTLGLAWTSDVVEAPDVRRAALAGVMLGLAADTRYVGIALLPVAFLWVTSKVRGRALLAWTLGAVVPVALWIAHDLVAFGRPLGPGLPAGPRTLGEVLRILLGSLRWEFLPPALAITPFLAFPALALVGVAVLWALKRGGIARLAALVALVQLAAVVFATWRYAINDPNGRYTLVAWPFLGLVACAAVQAGIARAFTQTRAATIAYAGASGIALLVAGAGFGAFLATTIAPPARLIARRHLQVAMLQIVEPTGGPILTDSGHLLRVTTGRSTVQVPPPRYRLREFNEADEARWRALGVREALFRIDNRGRLGPWLDARIDGGWAVADSAAGLVLYRF